MNVRRGVFRILAVMTTVLAIPLALQINYAAQAETYDFMSVSKVVELGSYIAFIWIVYWAGVWITAGFRS
jgi:hypothetical protein